jgi:carbamate kinase
MRRVGVHSEVGKRPAAFATATGKTAAIGALADIAAIVRGDKGTLVSAQFGGLSWH